MHNNRQKRAAAGSLRGPLYAAEGRSLAEHRSPQRGHCYWSDAVHRRQCVCCATCDVLCVPLVFPRDAYHTADTCKPLSSLPQAIIAPGVGPRPAVRPHHTGHSSCLLHRRRT
eukprot:6177079-Pleurochrysis_carterae.AAC.2